MLYYMLSALPGIGTWYHSWKWPVGRCTLLLLSTIMHYKSIILIGNQLEWLWMINLCISLKMFYITSDVHYLGQGYDIMRGLYHAMRMWSSAKHCIGNSSRLKWKKSITLYNIGRNTMICSISDWFKSNEFHKTYKN